MHLQTNLNFFGKIIYNFFNVHTKFMNASHLSKRLEIQMLTYPTLDVTFFGHGVFNCRENVTIGMHQMVLRLLLLYETFLDSQES